MKVDEIKLCENVKFFEILFCFDNLVFEISFELEKGIMNEF